MIGIRNVNNFSDALYIDKNDILLTSKTIQVTLTDFNETLQSCKYRKI